VLAKNLKQHFLPPQTTRLGHACSC
jgi:hypothetical protein